MTSRRRSTGKLHSGTLVIAAMVLAAAGASAFAWWHQYQQGRRALEYWTAEGAKLIRRAPNVELMRLGEPAAPAGEERAFLLGRPVAERQDISRAPGLVHARQALISDTSYLWGTSATATPDWEYALRFADGGEEILIALDLTGGYAGKAGDTPPLRLGPTIQKGLRTFFAEQAGIQRRSPKESKPAHRL
jgi:hypothetical protein